MTYSNLLWLFNNARTIYFRKGETYAWAKWIPTLGYNKDWNFRIERWN